LDTKI